MGLFSNKPRGLTPAQEAAQRRGVHIPDDDRVNAAQARADHRSAPPAAPRPTGYETKTVTFRMRERVGLVHMRPSADAGKLEKLIAAGWEIVSQTQAPHGARMTTYVLRRART